MDPQMKRLTRKAGRKSKASALSEFGPALFFIFIFAVFPVIDLIAMGFGYTSCVTLNDLQLREAAKLPKSIANSQTGPVLSTIPQKWMTTIAGAMSGLTENPSTTLTYEPYNGSIYVNVSTSVTVRPFLTIPFFTKIPGLGEPATFTIVNSRMLENPMYAVQ
jgi:hypothetical protein